MKASFCKILFPMLLAVSLTSQHTAAQSLEEVSFSDQLANYHTYVTDINDAGFITGYYDSAGTSHGFAINADGEVQRFLAGSGQSIKVEGLNNKGTLVVNITTGSTAVTYKVYYDAGERRWGTPQTVSGISFAGSVPLGINDKNDFTGWYQGATERWLWVKHDSITAGFSGAWQALRHSTTGPLTYYNTQAYGINDANIAVGAWTSGVTINPFTYSAATNTITTITGNSPSTRTRLHDINNANVACGEFRQSNNIFAAFYATVSGSSFSNVQSLVPIFHSNTIQSVANGINNKGEVVGAYLHPTTNTWVGFIYRPGVEEYRLPGFSWQKHTWNMSNTLNQNAQDVWTIGYCAGWDYNTMDPYAPSADSPLFDAFIKAAHPEVRRRGNRLNRACLDWISYARETDTAGGALASPNYQAWKNWAFTRVFNAEQFTYYLGICWGFEYTSALHYVDDAFLASWFPTILPGSDLSAYTNVDYGAVRGITRTYFKQLDYRIMRKYGVDRKFDIGQWQGLFRLKNTYLETDPAKRDPRGATISMGGGSHAVFPYKIRTPKKLPFLWNGVWAQDSVYVYDSNHPGDSLARIRVAVPRMAFHDDSLRYNRAGIYGFHFNEPGARELMQVARTQWKTTGQQEDTLEALTAGGATNYVFSAGGGQASWNNSAHQNTIPWLHASFMKDSARVTPANYTMDTTKSVMAMSTAYADSAMGWSLSTERRIMGLSRDALPSETDYGTFARRAIRYGTHEAVTKNLNGYLMEMAPDLMHGVNILASGLTMNDGDSILTENPSPYVYKITRFGTTSDTYNLWVYMAGADSLREFKQGGISMGGNSSHTILPYSGPGGKSVTILVDADNNGTIDSTIVVALTVKDMPFNDGSICAYPNPAGARLTVAFDNQRNGNMTISLLDIAGRTVYRRVAQVRSATNVELPLAGLATGAYLLQVQDEKGTLVYREKVVKE